MRAIRFHRMWAVATPVLQAAMARRTVAHFVQHVLPEGPQHNKSGTVEQPAPRLPSPPRAASKRTVDERSPEKEEAVEEPSALDDVLADLGISIEAQPRALPPRRLTYSLAALHGAATNPYAPTGGGASRPGKQRRAWGM